MALIKCPECSKDISDTVKVCLHCGYQQPKAASEGWSGWVWGLIFIGGLVVVFFAYGAYLSSTPEGQERARERDAIDLCWRDHERRSLDANSRQFVAQTCEFMEQEFRKKHGREP